jgi:pimeloyl-ACP methyl ester carboxylesterase
MDYLGEHIPVIALAVIGAGIGGWIGVVLATVLLKGQLKILTGIAMAALGLVGGAATGFLVMPDAEQILAYAEDREEIIQLALSVDPSLRDRLLQQLRAAEQRGGSSAAMSELRDVQFELLAVHGPDLIPLAADEVVSEYALASAEYLDGIHRTDPEICYTYLAMSKQGSRYGMSPALYKRIFDSLDGIVDSAYHDPAPLTDQQREAAQMRLQALWVGITEGPDAPSFYLGEFEARPAQTAEEREGACFFLARLYSRVAAERQPLRSHILKVFYDGG